MGRSLFLASLRTMRDRHVEVRLSIEKSVRVLNGLVKLVPYPASDLLIPRLAPAYNTESIDIG